MNMEDKKIPQHIAIIMDGNGRWAKKRMMPRIYGHRHGVETIKKITSHAHKRGVKVLTVYAFSTENWSRPKDEVNYLLKLPGEFFNSYITQLQEKNIRLSHIGDASRLPRDAQEMLEKGLRETENNTGMILNIAINYGSRQEITHACKTIAKKAAQGELDPETIDENTIEEYLMTNFLGNLAQPDLMIRTSGELRLSNFLLWQLSYTELYFTDVYWPDFGPADFDKAIEEYSKRQRRYGKVKSS